MTSAGKRALMDKAMPQGWDPDNYTVRELRQQEILADKEWSRRIRSVLHAREA